MSSKQIDTDINSHSSVDRIENACNKAKPVTIEGITYPSISAASKALGISKRTLNRRINSGYTDSEILHGKQRSCPDKPKMHRGKSVIIRGKEFNSLFEVSKCYSIPFTTIVQRYKSGKRGEELIIESRGFDKERKPKPIVIYGVEYPSIYRAAKETGIPYQTLVSRINRGVEDKDLPILFRDIEKYNFRGEAFTSVEALAKRYKVTGSNIHEVCKSKGCSVESALEIILERRDKRTQIVEGTAYKTLSEACKAYGKSYGYVHARLLEGKDLEEILTSETIYKLNRGGSIPVEFRNEQFDSKISCLQKYGVSYSSICKYQKRGLSFQEAMEKTIANKSPKSKQ